MTPKQYEAAIKRLGLSQVGAARYFGISERQSRRFIKGDSAAPIPIAIEMLLNMLLEAELSPLAARGKYCKAPLEPAKRYLIEPPEPAPDA